MRLTRDDWLAGGFDLLRERGAGELTIDSLCQRLGVTKGSFYHHFRNREELSQALLEEWERRLTSSLIETSRHGQDFKDRNHRLTQKGQETFDPRLELAIRSWAQQDAEVRAAQERVDRKRIDYLSELFGLIARAESTATDLALIRYAFSVGAQQLQPMLDPVRYSRLFAILEHQLELAAETGDDSPCPTATENDPDLEITTGIRTEIETAIVTEGNDQDGDQP